MRSAVAHHFIATIWPEKKPGKDDGGAEVDQAKDYESAQSNTDVGRSKNVASLRKRSKTFLFLGGRSVYLSAGRS